MIAPGRVDPVSLRFFRGFSMVSVLKTHLSNRAEPAPADSRAAEHCRRPAPWISSSIAFKFSSLAAS